MTRSEDHTIDLGAYLRFVGLEEIEYAPTVATLRTVQEAHTNAIRFSTVPYALGELPPTDLPTIERRLIHEGRGGTCLEQIPLFAAVLDALGFQTETRISACNYVGSPVKTHLILLVRAVDDERRWLADVGWGTSVFVPVPLPFGTGYGEVVRHLGWEQKVEVRHDGRISLMERGPPPSAPKWRHMHYAEDEAVEEGAIEAANRFGGLDPDSPYTNRLIAIRTTDRGRERLNGRQLEIYSGEAEPYVEHLEPMTAVEVLRQRFRVHVDADERKRLMQFLAHQERSDAAIEFLDER